MMADNQIIVIPGRAYPLGVYKSSEGIHVSAVFMQEAEREVQSEFPLMPHAGPEIFIAHW